MKKFMHLVKCYGGDHTWNMFGVCIFCGYDRNQLSGGKSRKKIWLSDNIKIKRGEG